MRLTFLGTGTSHGVPTIDCMLDDYAHCPRDVCRKALTDRRHRRLRASIWVETEGLSFLIDTSQDFRQQVLEQRVGRIDAVLYTHGHADHIYGLPDIRSFCRVQGHALDVYGSAETVRILRASFSYVFYPPEMVGGGIPSLEDHVLSQHLAGVYDPVIVSSPSAGLSVEVQPVGVVHGPLSGCVGYRVGDMAYLPDVHEIPEVSLALLCGLDLLVINCLRFRPHATHLSLSQTLDYVARLAPRRCLLTHMAHDIDYQIDSAELPEGVAFAYDGQVVEL